MLNVSTLMRLRHMFLIVSAVSFLSSLYFIAMGVVETVHAMESTFDSIGSGQHVNAGIKLFEALDRFLIAVLFYIFGIGMIKLFMPEVFGDAQLPKWLDIKDIRELKVLLWETVLVTLMVLSVTDLVTAREHLTWDALILPAVIATLSVALFFMRSRVDRGGGH